MNAKDRKEIGLNLTVLMDAILNENSSAEEVANSAIDFCAEMYKKYPELKDYIETVRCDDFDQYVRWINWERRYT